MPEYITPADLSALNSAVKSAEAYSSAKRGAEGILERISASRDAAGIADHEIFNALARGADNKTGLHWLCRLNGALTEYLGSWGTLVLFGVSLVATLVVIKQNAKAVWTAVKEFVTNHPLITGALVGGAGFAIGKYFKDDVDDAADVLISVATAALPLPVAVLVEKTSNMVASAQARGASAPATAPAAGAPPAANPNAAGKSPTAKLTENDGYTRDAYTRDEYPRRRSRDAFSGNIG